MISKIVQLTDKDEFVWNSRNFNVIPHKKYKTSIIMKGEYETPYSGYFGMVMLDENNIEITRKIQWLNDFSGKENELQIICESAPKTKQIVIIIRINKETSKKSQCKIGFSELENINIEEVNQNVKEDFDNSVSPFDKYEFNVQEKIFAKSNISPNVIFDVGANVGEMTTIYKLLFPNAKIYSFEPIPKTYEKLEKKSGNNIKTYQFAVGDKDATIEILETEHSGYSSILKPSEFLRKSESIEISEFVKIKNKHKVRQIKLDTFCDENKIPLISILKLDTQGSELKILNGVSNMLKKQNIDMIYTEVLFADLYEDQCYYHDIASYLASFDYQIYDLVHISRGYDGKIFDGDAIFLNSKLNRNFKKFYGQDKPLRYQISLKDEIIKKLQIENEYLKRKLEQRKT